FLLVLHFFSSPKALGLCLGSWIAMTMSSRPIIGFVGLGAMGFGMATHLVKQGYPVKGYDVFAKSVERFNGAGGIPTSSLRESATGVEYYIVMVATAAQAQEALFNKEVGLVEGMSIPGLGKRLVIVGCNGVMQKLVPDTWL